MLQKFLIFFGLKKRPEVTKKIIKKTEKQCEAEKKFLQGSVALQLTIEQRNKIRNELKNLPSSIRGKEIENN